MATLRLAFASSLALELIAAMSVALVAPEIGLRLDYGHLLLRTGLFVLILAPEAYLPLRTLGAQFHVTVDGLAVARRPSRSWKRQCPLLPLVSAGRRGSGPVTGGPPPRPSGYRT